MNKKKIMRKDNYIKILPLAFIIFIVPLIVRLKTVSLTGYDLKFSPSGNSYPDFFNYYKAVWLISLSILSIFACLLYKNFKKYSIKISKKFCIPLGIFYLFVMLSTFFSDYKKQAFFGYNDRFEGFLVISCYISICFISAHFITYEEDLKIIFGFLICSAIIISLLGISQFWGLDLFQTDFGKHLILSAKDYTEIGSTLEFKFPTRYIYSTLYNPNYVGSYFSMLFPISIILYLFCTSLKTKLLTGIFCCLSFINLLGCLSTTGYIGAIIATLVLMAILYKKVLKSWTSLATLFVCFISILFFMNVTSEGTLFPEFYKSSSNKSNLSSANTVSKPDNSIKDIKLIKNTASIVLVDNVLNIEIDKSDFQCNFTDSKGKMLEFTIENTENKTLTFNDPRYEGVKLKIDGSVFNITAGNTVFNICVNKDSGDFKFLDHAANQVDLKDVAKIGFEGKETFASSRGYIWSRTIPLLKNTVFLGYGPDTYIYHFPQNDFVGKIKAFSTPYIIVDKPHNMYLQIAINTGIISLIAFLAFVLLYLIVSIKLYVNYKLENIYLVTGLSSVVAVVGFMVSSLANDSVISVSPVFWIILGIGFASNRLYKLSLQSK